MSVAVVSSFGLDFSMCRANEVLENNKETFNSLNTIAVGVSVDTVPSKKAWADSLGIRKTRLLSDFWPHGKVAKTVWHI